jgi:multidrug resistance efflux pump
MIAAIFNVYLVILFALVKLRVVPFNLFWKISPAIVMVALLFGLFIPMGWGAPGGSALVIRNSVAIVPDVAGEVIEVPIAANTPLRAGDVQFRIDPVPFKSTVDALAARLPAGAVGSAAIFTDHLQATHIIRKVLLRQTAILNYVLPF